MYRVINQGSKWYAVEFDNLLDEVPNFEEHISEGSPVIICESLQDAEELLPYEEIELIE